MFDLLFNNTTQIQPEVHSTDTHGTNEVMETGPIYRFPQFPTQPTYRPSRLKIHPHKRQSCR